MYVCTRVQCIIKDYQAQCLHEFSARTSHRSMKFPLLTFYAVRTFICDKCLWSTKACIIALNINKAYALRLTYHVCFLILWHSGMNVRYATMQRAACAPRRLDQPPKTKNNKSRCAPSSVRRCALACGWGRAWHAIVAARRVLSVNECVHTQ